MSINSATNQAMLYQLQQWTHQITSATSTSGLTQWISPSTGTSVTYNTQIGLGPVPTNDWIEYERLPPPKNFNKYINASDLLQEFIKFLAENKVRKRDAKDLPLELFIKWLVIRACEEDKEEPNVVLTLPSRVGPKRCLGCGRFIHRVAPVLLHGERCAQFYFSRAGLTPSLVPATLPLVGG